MEIDAVITWVDGEDPEHRRKREKYSAEISKSQTSTANANTRFNSEGELWYSLRLIRINAPWVRNIFLVTDQQKPGWLTQQLTQDLKIIVVDHTTLFRDFPNNLPTFSSRSIESTLNNIPSLSNYFIYLNDDFFIIKPTTPEDFFFEGKLVLRGAWGWKNSLLDKAWRIITQKWRSLGLVGRRPEIIKLPQKFFFFNLAHAPYPLKKDTFDHVFAPEKQAQNSQFRFRNTSQYWPIGYVTNTDIIKNGYIRAKKDWVYINAESNSLQTIKKRFHQCAEGPSKFLCIQSLDQASPSKFEECINFLNRLIGKRRRSNQPFS